MEDPTIFDFPAKLEQKYSYHKTRDGIPRVFFRKRMSANDIIEMSKSYFNLFSDNNWHPILDATSPCSESCEIGTDSADREETLIQELEWNELEASFTE